MSVRLRPRQPERREMGGRVAMGPQRSRARSPCGQSPFGWKRACVRCPCPWNGPTRTQPERQSESPSTTSAATHSGYITSGPARSAPGTEECSRAVKRPGCVGTWMARRVGAGWDFVRHPRELTGKVAASMRPSRWRSAWSGSSEPQGSWLPAGLFVPCNAGGSRRTALTSTVDGGFVFREPAGGRRHLTRSRPWRVRVVERVGADKGAVHIQLDHRALACQDEFMALARRERGRTAE